MYISVFQRVHIFSLVFSVTIVECYYRLLGRISSTLDIDGYFLKKYLQFRCIIPAILKMSFFLQLLIACSEWTHSDRNLRDWCVNQQWRVRTFIRTVFDRHLLANKLFWQTFVCYVILNNMFCSVCTAAKWPVGTGKRSKSTLVSIIAV
jgi:hypothetical protein